MSAVPKEKTFDSALAMIREGNRFIADRCRRYDTNIFETRVLLKQTFCISGKEAASIFYRKGNLTRRGAIPISVLVLLQDKGSVATLDDAAHQWRKKMFMSLMTPVSIHQLVDNMELRWRQAVSSWQGMGKVNLFDELNEVLFQAVCDWSGISLTEPEIKKRTREIAMMIDGAGAIGPRNWKAIFMRRRTEAWVKGLIRQVRAGTMNVSDSSPLAVISFHKDESGKLLDESVATVEVLNIIRPTVAVSRFILFSALALHQYPECRSKIISGDDKYLEFFVQEVRRFLPFFPFVGGIVREPFDWNNCHFPSGARILLDIYGTNHDAAIWKQPDHFNPERFESWQANPFSFIPQGGGDYFSNHRCAGEHITIAIMKRAVNLLCTHMSYDVVKRDYTIDVKRMPALPKNDFLIENVQLT